MLILGKITSLCNTSISCSIQAVLARNPSRSVHLMHSHDDIVISTSQLYNRLPGMAFNNAYYDAYIAVVRHARLDIISKRISYMKLSFLYYRTLKRSIETRRIQ